MRILQLDESFRTVGLVVHDEFFSPVYHTYMIDSPWLGRFAETEETLWTGSTVNIRCVFLDPAPAPAAWLERYQEPGVSTPPGASSSSGWTRYGMMM